MSEETQWLREFAATGSQPAFAALSGRYVDLVYTSARRQVGGDAHLAEDVTQAVFIVLAEKARSVPVDRPLSAWLLKVTRYCAANARRTRLHRETHERRAAEMAPNETTGNDDADWNDELAPLLDEGLSKLRPADRDVLLLKYFEKKSLREVGEALGVSEEAAQKRVTRAVDRLRDFFKRRGATVSAVALATLLTSESSQAAPASVAASVGSGAAGGSTAASTLAKGAMVAMATQKTTAVVIGGVLLLLGIGGGAVAVHSLAGNSSSGARTVTLQAPAANASVNFSDGSNVECVAISEVTFGKTGWVSEMLGKSNPPVPAKTWWKPDGSVASMPDLGLDQVYLGDAPGRRELRLVFDTTGTGASAADVSIRIPNSQGYASSVRTIGQTRRTNMAVSLPDTADKIDIRVGLAKGPWRTDVTTPVKTTEAGTAVATTQPNSPVTYGKITSGDPNDNNGGGNANVGCSIELLRDRVNVGDRQRSIRALTTDGKELWCDSSHGSSERTVYHFPCPREKLAVIVWLSRPWEWGTISGVSLKPATAAGSTTAPAK